MVRRYKQATVETQEEKETTLKTEEMTFQIRRWVRLQFLVKERKRKREFQDTQ